MSVEAWTRTPEYTVSGIGPYQIAHPYVVDAIRVSVRLTTGLLPLSPADFTVTPTSSDTQGDVYLTSLAASTHAGRKLIIDRVTPDEQGWVAVQGEREAGLAAQLDRMVQAHQETRAEIGGALRIRDTLDAFDWTDGTVPVRDGDRVVSGPTATQIAAAEARAAEAEAFALAAAASAAAALAKENSMLRDRGAWVSGILYSPSDIFTFGGRSYITQTAHFATTVAADQAASRIRIFADKGDAGAGSGDMLKTENLSGLANYALARTNMGLGALAVKAQAAFADIDPAAVITDVETLAANKVANALPVAKAVTDYIDGLLIPAAPLASWTYSTNVTSIPLTGLAGWDSVRIVGEITTSSFIEMQVSPDNGVTWRTSGYVSDATDGGGSLGGTFGMRLSRNNAGVYSAIDWTLDFMASATLFTQVSGQARAPNNHAVSAAGKYATAEVCTAVRLVNNTYSGGYLRVYGDRRSAP